MNFCIKLGSNHAAWCQMETACMQMDIQYGEGRDQICSLQANHI